jgi:hypothetical protein
MNVLTRNLKELTQIKRLIVGIMLDITVKNTRILKKEERRTYSMTMKLVYIFSKIKDFLAKFRSNLDEKPDAPFKRDDFIAVAEMQIILRRLHNMTMIKSFCWQSTSYLFRATTQLRILGMQQVINEDELALQNKFFFEQQNKFLTSFV